MLVAALSPAAGHHEASAGTDARYASDFPDPHVIYDEASRTYVAYGTNTGGSTLPTLTAAGLDGWTVRPDTFGPPGWAAPVGGGAEVWAPSVHQLANGQWRAYSAVRERNGGAQHRYCISVATGPGPLGPFTDESTEPLTCGYGAAGAIDPWVHVDDAGDPWLVWKMEDHKSVTIADDDVHFPLPQWLIAVRALARARGDAVPARTIGPAPDAIWAQRLDVTGLAFHQPDPPEEPGAVGEPPSTATVLLTAQPKSWERGIVESPAMFSAGGRLHLLYSGNRYQSHEYATGWATCASPAGPCTRARSGPILAHGGTVNGPGGASVFVDGAGDHRIAFHAWTAPHVSYEDGGTRLLHIEQLCVLPDGALSVRVPAGWRFCDVDAATWFGPGVAWMADGAITTGVSEGRFAPERPLSRAEAVTFLWRWAGRPTSAATSPFTDVEEGRYYTQAARWAAAVGIVRGTTPTTFEPDAPIDRAQVVTILHRAAGEPAASGGAAFTDVAAGAYHAAATAWASEVGIITGRTPTEFRPTERATRAQFSTMLCRFSRTTPAGERWPASSRCP